MTYSINLLVHTRDPNLYMPTNCYRLMGEIKKKEKAQIHLLEYRYKARVGQLQEFPHNRGDKDQERYGIELYKDGEGVVEFHWLED